jgi:hypothetical protein
MEDYEGSDWVLVADETPVDEPRRDELLEAFQIRYTPEEVAGAGVDDDPEDHDEDYEDVGRE